MRSRVSEGFPRGGGVIKESGQPREGGVRREKWVIYWLGVIKPRETNGVFEVSSAQGETFFLVVRD